MVFCSSMFIINHTNPRPRSLFEIPQQLLSFVNKQLSTSCSSSNHSHHHHHRQQQHVLLSLILKHQTSREAIQQVHSHLITTGVGTHKLLIWNALLHFYSLSVFPEEAVLLFKHLQRAASSFNSFTYSFLFKACAKSHLTIPGIQLHALSLKSGFDLHIYVQTSLLGMYSAGGSFVEEAKRVFYEMPHKNSVTWNSMITGLAKWGHLDLAHSLFNQMPTPNVVSWTGMIEGYTRMNQPKQALALFHQMVVHEGINPTQVTLITIFPAISCLGTLEHCQSIHAYGEKCGFNSSDIRVSNSLVDAYAKCGCIASASRFFEELSAERRNLVSWTSMISGFAMHGMAKEAVKNFERMIKGCLKPNRVTFLSILNACSHGGLVEEGLKFFKKMVDECLISPDIKHYGCLVDMLGRAGRLEEAEKIALEIPAEIANVVIWRTLLGACSFHGNVKMGERVSRKTLEMEREYGGDYVLLSNIFSSVGRFGDAEWVRRLMDQRNAPKVPGLSLGTTFSQL